MPFSKSQYAREIEVCLKLTREAGELAIGCRDGNLEVELKAGDEPVTVADRLASDHIVRGLESAFPNDVVISEENADDLAIGGQCDGQSAYLDVDGIDGAAHVGGGAAQGSGRRRGGEAKAGQGDVGA